MKNIKTAIANSKIVVFEGVDGVGKSTLIEQIRRKLLQQGHSVLMVANPYGVSKQSWSTKIHHMIESENFYPITEAMLYMAIIMENQKFYYHKKYSYVLIDRYIHSTLAYNVLYPSLIKQPKRLIKDSTKICRSLVRLLKHSILDIEILPFETFIIKNDRETFNLPDVNLEVLEKAYDETRPFIQKLYNYFGVSYQERTIYNNFNDKNIAKQILKIISI